MEQFNEKPVDHSKKGLWKAVRGLKKKFTPQYVRMKNMDNQHVPRPEGQPQLQLIEI